MHRFFVSPDQFEDDRVTITGPAVHHIRDVLRLRPGVSIIVLDNSGWEREVEIVEVGRERVVSKVLSRTLATGEPRTKVSLYQGVLKGSHFELVLQKGTELGIVEFVPLISQRCVIGSLDDVDKKRGRWERIVQEAAEQSRRGRLPSLQSAMLFSQACERARQTGGLSLMPWEEEKKVNLKLAIAAILEEISTADVTDPEFQKWLGDLKLATAAILEVMAAMISWEEEERVNLKLVFGKGGKKAKGKKALSFPSRPFSISLFVGPEGGFTFEEVTLAQRYGIVPITLGPRILRADTAGLVATAAILYELGDLS